MKTMIFAAVLLATLTGYSQSCAKFKNGTFKVTDPWQR